MHALCADPEYCVPESMGLGSMHVHFPGRGGPDLLSTPRPEHVLNKYKIFRAFVQVDVFWWCFGGFFCLFLFLNY